MAGRSRRRLGAVARPPDTHRGEVGRASALAPRQSAKRRRSRCRCCAHPCAVTAVAVAVGVAVGVGVALAARPPSECSASRHRRARPPHGCGRPRCVRLGRWVGRRRRRARRPHLSQAPLLPLQAPIPRAPTNAAAANTCRRVCQPLASANHSLPPTSSSRRVLVSAPAAPPSTSAPADPPSASAPPSAASSVVPPPTGKA